MAQRQPIKHGTEAGYRAELQTDSVCERCRNGHRVFDKQYTKAYKRQGIKYGRFDVLDHLYRPGKASARPAAAKTRPEPSDPGRARVGPESATEPTDSTDQASTSAEQPSLSQRLTDALSGFTLKAEPKYVETDEIPDYLTTVDPDPEPQDPDNAEVRQDEFVITKDGMVLIEENLGTYLSVIGMTLEMVDPYCGPILADNLDNIVKRWSKVIARYPAAAHIFMSKGGGVLMDWIGAIQATWPVLFAIYEHHLARTIVTEKGRVMRVMNNGQAPTVDPTMPEYDYTVR